MSGLTAEAWREIAGDLKPLLALLDAAETTGETP